MERLNNNSKIVGKKIVAIRKMRLENAVQATRNERLYKLRNMVSMLPADIKSLPTASRNRFGAVRCRKRR